MKCTLFLYFVLFLSENKCHVAKSLEVTTDKVVTVIESDFKNDFKKISDVNPTVQETTVYGDTKTNPGFKELTENGHKIKENNGKSPELQPPEESTPENVVQTTKNITWQKSTENRYDSKRVYLEDVVFALKNQNWTENELPCLNATLHLLRSLQNFTLWAVWEWDSISSQPQGLLFGNRYELGNFDECLNAPWADSHPELRTQYCLAEIVLERTDKPVKRLSETLDQPYESALNYVMRNKSSIHRPLNELTWGGCVPASCGPRAVERLMATLLARSHLGAAGMRARIAVTDDCQRTDQPREFDGLFYGFLSFALIVLSASLTCTYLNCSRGDKARSLKEGIIQAFCLKTNAKDLMNVKKEGAEVLYGIRFLTIAFIVMDHQVGIFNSGPIMNGLEVDHASLGVMAMFVLHDDLFVDTFFVLSGFLVAMALKKLRSKSMFNPLLLIIKRYIRLVVAFAVVIFFYAAVYPYIGSGPLWNLSISAETEPCRKNWWLGLLMLGNYIDNENICIVISWYIPCDFHFFLVATLVFWVYTRHRRLGLTLIAALTIAAVGAPGVINYVRQLPAIQLFTYDFVKNPRANEQFHVTYIKSHARFPAYIVGVLAGYFFATCRDSGKLKRLSKKWSVIGAVVGLVIMTGVMVVGATYLWRSYHPLEGAIYAALNRPIWACGVALFILCCCLGRVPYIDGFLTWYPWVPLSRLSYGLYLAHTVIITRNVYVTRSPQHYDHFSVITSALGVVMIGCMASLAIWLFVEAPINNLFTVLIKNKLKKISPADERTPEDPAVPGPSHCRHLQSNLPATIQISSKM